MVVKGIRDSLVEKLEKCSDLKMEASKILKVAEEVEIAMFGDYSREKMRIGILFPLFQEHLVKWEQSTRTSIEVSPTISRTLRMTDYSGEYY